MGQQQSPGFHQRQIDAGVPGIVPDEPPSQTVARLALFAESIDEDIAGTPAFVRKENRKGPVSRDPWRPPVVDRWIPRFGKEVIEQVKACYADKKDEDD